MYPKNKFDITETIKNELPVDNIWKTQPIDTLLYKWWKTGRGGNELRLTDHGKRAFEDASISHYDFFSEIDSKHEFDVFRKKLTKKLDCPYFLGVKELSVFVRIYDDKIAVLVSLHGGIKSFVDIKHERTK